MNNINPNPSSCFTQVKLILDYMRDGNEITSLEAVGKFGCMRLAARIADIRKKLGDGEEYVYSRFVSVPGREKRFKAYSIKRRES